MKWIPRVNRMSYCSFREHTLRRAIPETLEDNVQKAMGALSHFRIGL